MNAMKMDEDLVGAVEEVVVLYRSKEEDDNVNCSREGVYCTLGDVEGKGDAEHYEHTT